MWKSIDSPLAHETQHCMLVFKIKMRHSSTFANELKKVLNISLFKKCS